MTVMVFWADPSAPPLSHPVARSQPNGSGVWLGRAGYVATCYHVIANWPGPLKIGIARDPYVTEGSISVSVSGATNVFDATLVAWDAAMDVAILKAETPPGDISFYPLVSGAPMGTVVTPQLPTSPRGATLQTQFPQLGESLFVAGFPLPAIAQRNLIFQNGTFTGILKLPSPGPPVSELRMMLSLSSNPGNSGGPVINADGQVVGLLEGVLQSPIRDEAGRPVPYRRQRLDGSGQPVFDANHQPVLEDAPLMQNSCISMAVPAKLIADLAKKKGIKLE